MEVIKLIKFDSNIVKGYIESAKKQSKKIPKLTLFNNLIPTAVLLSPTKSFNGSLHYMFLPPGSEQEFHYHPGARYLIVLGDINLFLFYSNCGIDENPHIRPSKIKIPKNSLCVIRFEANLWHKFLTKKEDGGGVLAFSFHEDDQIDFEQGTRVELMEDKTNYWRKY